ncbi:MAG TPA: hypothetical protein DEO86_16505 [Colwellia sp.]|nr:hypothetical protein [Colwellia sp.]|tara:strand:+ start:198 stop:467 length:270 start_codon:yes stop_codon:yes gene_type:complete
MYIGKYNENGTNYVDYPSLEAFNKKWKSGSFKKYVMFGDKDFTMKPVDPKTGEVLHQAPKKGDLYSVQNIYGDFTRYIWNGNELVLEEK